MENANGLTKNFDVNIEKRQNCYRWNFITTHSENEIEPVNVIIPGEEFTARLWVVSGAQENITNTVPSNVIDADMIKITKYIYNQIIFQ